MNYKTFSQRLREWWQGYPDSIIATQIKTWIEETNSDSIHWKFCYRLEGDVVTSFHYQIIEHPKITFAAGYHESGLGEGLVLWFDNVQITEAPRRLLGRLHEAIRQNTRRQDRREQEALVKQV